MVNFIHFHYSLDYKFGLTYTFSFYLIETGRRFIKNTSKPQENKGERKREEEDNIRKECQQILGDVNSLSSFKKFRQLVSAFKDFDGRTRCVELL